MTNQKHMSVRDKQVEVRNSILTLLNKGCDELNQGSRDFLASILKSIHNKTDAFSVDMESDYVFEAFGDTYTKSDYMIVIREGKAELIVVVKLKSGKCEGEWRAYEVSPYDFEYDEQIEAEAKAERDAEKAMSEYYEGRNSHWNDDPRGN